MSVALNGEHIYTLTCSPWDTEELVVGYLYLRGIITKKEQLAALKVDETAGIVEVCLHSPDQEAEALLIIESELKVSAIEVNTIANLLESNSALFKKTGGVHSAALVKDTKIIAWFEDIGRHSAVDKLAGWCVLNDYDTQNCVLLFSGRVPYEIIMKVIRLGCPVIISPGAPTNLSIDLAEQYGVTLIGFAKRGQFNVYSHPRRVTP